MGYKGTLRAIEAAKRRQERESERRAREQAKLSAIEQARLEVEGYERHLAMLASPHKVAPDTWDWAALAAALPPHRPYQSSYHELQTRQRTLVLRPEERGGREAALENAQQLDERIFQEAMQAYGEEMVQWDKTRRLARRILARDTGAYEEALREFSPLTDLAELGASFEFTFASSSLLDCGIVLSGVTTIPGESKALTPTGKLSVKAMAKSRSLQLYRDYICGSVLRTARELFAFLPLDTILATALVNEISSPTAAPPRIPVLSVVLARSIFSQVPLDDLDASEAIARFGQLRASLKSLRNGGTFPAITPWTPPEVLHASVEDMGLDDLFAHIRQIRARMKARRSQVKLPGLPTRTLGDFS